ncbi:MAG: hypothetical protein DME25_16385 [Verrucomicrobia bacterium]|nr:MAG: hypothetical protein DME25_16385 [Verrucomicrobiota bacterium]
MRCDTNGISTPPTSCPAPVGSYLVTVTNSLGAVTSAPVTLSLTNSLPLITLQPGSVAANVGTNVSFTITVIGTKPMFYQWFFNDVALFSPTNASLTLTNPASGSWLLVTNGLIGSSLTVTSTLPGDEGAYKVSVSNTFGAVLSDEVLLDVLGFGSGM